MNLLTATAQEHKEPVEIPDKDPFGDPFERQYAPTPSQKPGAPEPVILPVFPKEEPEPKEAVATVTTQREAQAIMTKELQEFEAEEEASYQAYIKKHNLSW